VDEFEDGLESLNTEESTLSETDEEINEDAGRETEDGREIDTPEDAESLNGNESEQPEQRKQRQSEHVPYEQFQAKAAEAAEYRELCDALTEVEPGLKPYLDAGWKPKDAVRALMQQIQQERATQDQTYQINGELNQWEENGLIDPSVKAVLAPFLTNLVQKVSGFEPLAQNYQNQQAQVRLNTAADSILTKYPDAERDDVVFRLQAGDAAGAEATAKRQHEKYNVSRDKVIADYTAKSGARGKIPVPATSGSGAPVPRASAIPDPVADPDAFGKYLETSKKAAFNRRYDR
jgi:hypothetical protein